MLQLHNILSGVWCLDTAKSLDYLPLISSFIKGEPVGKRLEPESQQQSYETRVKAHTAPIIAAGNKGYNVGFSWSEWYPEEIEDDSVAIIRITGAITKYASCENYGIQNYASLMHRCYANDKIKGIILVLDTPGGEARAMVDMIDALNSRNKPITAFVSDGCFSAGMGIATQCDAIVMNNEFARCGSIGTMMTIMDQRGYFEKQGINLIDLYATASKDKNQDYRDILDGKTDAAVARLDQLNGYLLKSVKKGRGERLTADKSEWGTGKTFSAKEALEMGLIDQINPLQKVIDYFVF